MVDGGTDVMVDWFSDSSTFCRLREVPVPLAARGFLAGFGASGSGLGLAVRGFRAFLAGATSWRSEGTVAGAAAAPDGGRWESLK